MEDLERLQHPNFENSDRRKRRREQVKESETRRRLRLKSQFCALKSILFDGKEVTREDILRKALEVLWSFH